MKLVDKLNFLLKEENSNHCKNCTKWHDDMPPYFPKFGRRTASLQGTGFCGEHERHTNQYATCKKHVQKDK
jgi:hypothetical protein